jgi:Tfp pilus assembly PilM family ATPase
MLSRFRSRNSAITFDVGSAGIRAFQLAARGAHLSSRDSLRLDLLPSHGQVDEQPPPPDYSRLARLVGQGSFSGSDVGLVLSPPEARFCTLRLPRKALDQPEKRVREALAWEVAREMRADAHELEVRYWQLPPGHRQGLNVMAVALPIERALSWYEVLAHDRLRLRRIDVSPCALAHLACRMWTPQANELWGILDLGFRRATLTVVLGEVPTYIRLLSASCGSWTGRLAQAFEVPHAVAEQIKRMHGIRPTERGVRAPQSNQPSAGRRPALHHAEDIPSVVFGLLREPLDELAHEIKKCFAYVMQNFPDIAASRLLLAGGGAKLPGLAAYLEQQLALSVAPLANACMSTRSGGDAGATDDQGPPLLWERPLPDTAVQPEVATAVGGAILDLENP